MNLRRISTSCISFKVLSVVRRLVDDGLTAIAAIHDLSMAARYCDRLVLMSSGRVVAEGLPEEVLSPETIESAFGVRAAVYRDPVTACLAISLIGPADERSSKESPWDGETGDDKDKGGSLAVDVGRGIGRHGGSA